jgi:hypothetical protein
VRRTKTLVMLLPLAVALALAGPPANGHSSGGMGGRSLPGGNFGTAAHYGASSSLTGPAPLGASGPAPVHTPGSFGPVFGPGQGAGFNGGRNGGNHGGGGDDHRGGEPNRHRGPYGFYPVPYVLPYYGSDTGFYDSPAYDNPGPGPSAENGDTQILMMNQDALGQRLQQLTSEIEDLKSQQQPAPPPSSGAPAKHADSDTQNEVPITLVLHSGQQFDVRNYAVTDGVFWDFSKQPAQKIPISAIDLAASVKATEAKGGEFPPLSQPTP